MGVSQKVKEKADKRAAALRNNLQKRKAFIKEAKQTEKNDQGQGDDNAKS